ncbi:MAG: 4-hydroxythreonine-4-phosphate dehydrogenase PdxA [Deltaproteobacteria bacterium]|nr:4-hydroxythreonine-4-phosphate dehydrogenase PdxA [Deltaproteobacteria bacterium]
MKRIAISFGDPAGIGPEVVLRALADAPRGPIVFGARASLERVAERFDLPWPQNVAFIDIDPDRLSEQVVLGESGAAAGRLQLAALEAATDAVLAGEADALCTAPVTKASMVQVGFGYPGHTEYLAARCGDRKVAMMLAGPTLRVVPLTGHMALGDVSSALSIPPVVETLELVSQALVEWFACPRPRIALIAVNPHAGESGLCGSEEASILVPARDEARRRLLDRVDLVGPLAADGFFGRYYGQDQQQFVGAGAFDAVICAYHDQALIPFKMIHTHDGANLTLGLPFVRTSPVHGSALDLAPSGTANPASMRYALSLAERLTR